MQINTSIKNKIFIFFISIIICAIGIISYIGFKSSSSSYIESTLNYSNDTTNNLALLLEEDFSFIPNDTKYLSNFYALKNLLIWKSIGEKDEEKKWENLYTNALIDFMNKKKLYYKIRVLDTKGTEIVNLKYNRDLNKTFIIPKNHLQNKSNKKYFEEIKNLKPDTLFISEINLNEENGRVEKPYTPVVRFATAIYNQNGEKSGYLILNIFANKYLDFLKNMEKKFRYYLVNKDGDFFYNQDKSTLWAKQFNHNANIKDYYPNIMSKFKTKDNDTFELDNKLISFKKVHPYSDNQSNYWYLISEINTDIAFEKLEEFKNIFILTTLFIIIFVYFLSSYFIHKFTHPLEQLSKKLNALSRGEINKDLITYNAQDEIQTLINSTNILINAIENTTKQANTIADGDFSKEIKLLGENDQLGIAITKMTQRLREVANLSFQVSKGDYNINININNSNDILGIALNNMIDYLKDITSVSEAIARGDINNNYKIKDEKDRLGISIVNMSNYLNEILIQANKLANDDFSYKPTPKSNNDQLGISLLSMANKLENNSIKNSNENWFNEGINIFSDKLREFDNINDICGFSVEFISKYINASSAALYIYNKDRDILKLNSSYACKKDSLQKEYKLKDGIIGEVAYSKKSILLKNFEDNHHKIESALVILLPKEIYSLPIIHENKLYGVIEFSSLDEFTIINKNYITDTVNILSAILHSTTQNLKIKSLLEKSQRAYEELQLNSEELQSSNEQMQLQSEQLKIQAETLQNANEYKSEFLANMSHELRTPLNSIILLSSLFAKNKQNNLSVDDINKIKVINQSGNELLTLINDILDLSKVEAGKMELIVDEISSRDILNYINELFKHTAKEKNLSLILKDNFNDSFYNDNTRLLQVIKNLVSNSLKFTKEGSILIEISKNDSLGLPIKINVIDTGIGIAKDKQEVIFKAFSQADGSTSREYGGTGLGLSISTRFVELMKGKMKLESNLNQGSSFTLLLPNLSNEVKYLNNHNLSIKNLDDIINQIETNKNKQISSVLIIEDDINQQNEIKQFLNNEKIVNIDTVVSKEDAIVKLKNKSYNLAIIDLKLNDGNGSDICLYIKEHKLQTSSIIYTAKELTMNETDYLSSISDEIIIKNENSHLRLKDEFNKLLTKKEEVKPFDKKSTISIINRDNLINKHVLIVDDDIKNIFVLSTALQESNMQTTHAKNGKEALDILTQPNNIDIILMDIMMPIMNGYEAIKEIRKNSNISHLPIIAVTAKAMQADKEEAIKSGADDYLTKPINLEKLLSMISMWLNKNK